MKLILFFFIIISYLPCQLFAETGNENDGITLILNDADISELVRWASEVTHKNIILHPNVQGKVTVVAREPMSARDAYQVFLSVLHVHGLVVIEESGSLKVIPGAQARESAIPLTDDVRSGLSEDMVVRVFKVANIPASSLVGLLKPLIPQTAYLDASPETNSVIIADRANNIRKIQDLVERLDKSNILETDIVQLLYANASSVMGVIKELHSARGANSPSAVNVAADERSNSLLVTGERVARQHVLDLIRHLDQPQEGDGNALVLKLEYGNAVDLVPLLQGIVASLYQDSGQKTRELSIQAHDQLNAVIVAGPRSMLGAIREVIAQLDIPRAQVLVEALIVEVSEDLARGIGVEWRTANPGSGESVSGGFRSFPPEITPLGINNGEIILGSGISLGYFRHGNLRAIINLLTSEMQANILSTPTIVSLDNEEAEILVGSNVPFITGSQQRPGDLDPFQTIQRQDIGVTLKMKPRINNDNSITLDIEQSVESIAPSTGHTADIVTNKRMIRTRVQIADDDVLVLGGLMRDEMTDNENRVPGLGRIPVLGSLFKSKSRKVSKTNLMVFIHPKILRTPETSDHVSRERYDALRDRQLEFGDRHRNASGPSGPLLPERSTSAGNAP